jgi:hypothetical protein
MKYSKKREREDKAKLIKIVLENPRKYGETGMGLAEIFYGPQDPPAYVDSSKSMSMGELQSALQSAAKENKEKVKEMKEKEEYVTRLVKELKGEKIFASSGNGKLVVTSFDKVCGKGYISGKELCAMYREINRANDEKN